MEFVGVKYILPPQILIFYLVCKEQKYDTVKEIINIIIAKTPVVSNEKPG